MIDFVQPATILELPKPAIIRPGILRPSSADLAGLGLVPASPGGGSFRPAPRISYRDARGDGADQATYDFTSVDFGATVPGKTLLLAVVGVGTGTRAIDTFTVDHGGSVPITPALIGTQTAGIAGGNTQVVHLYKAPMLNNVSASGTTRVAWDGTMNRCFIGVIAAYNLRGINVASPVGQGGVNIDPSLSINTIKGGVVFGAALGSATPTFSWTGLTKHYDDLASDSQAGFSFASLATTTAESPRSINVAISGTQTYSVGLVAILY